MILVPCRMRSATPARRPGAAPDHVLRKRPPPRHGKLQIEDFGAENMNMKRLLENKAGNLQSFGRGMSYLAEAAPVPDMAAQDKAQDKAAA